MAIFNNSKKTNELNEHKVIGYISGSPKDLIKEQFHGQVVDIPIQFPKDIGIEHPFNFEDIEKTYKTIGVITGAVNKFTDAIVGDFSIKIDNEQAYDLLVKILIQTNFNSVLRDWIRDGLLGNGFMELDLKTKQIKILSAKNMFVQRDDQGNVLGYTQWLGEMKRYSRKVNKVIRFKTNQIAHLKINKISDEAYGMGIVFPNERVIENMLLNEQDLHKLISRKAGAPMHIRVGLPGESVRTEDIDAFKASLQFLTNSTEWVTDDNVKIDYIEFGDIGKNLTDTLKHDMEMLSFGMEIPIVLFGAGNIPEGLAKVQLESFQRKVAAIQEEIESIIEQSIFKPILESMGFIGVNIGFIWNLPGETEINTRLDKLNMLLSNTTNLSLPMRQMIELELARLLHFEDAPKLLAKPGDKPEPEEVLIKKNNNDNNDGEQ